MSSIYAPHTGFGDDYVTSAKFRILHPEQTLIQWTSEPHLTYHTVRNSNKTVTQYHGRAPWRVSLRLYFDTMYELEKMDDAQGQIATLRYMHGLSKTVGGYREAIGGTNYLTLPDTLLVSLTDERYEIGGACEALATFSRLYVSPPV